MSLVSQTETGQAPASPEFAEACDTALGTDGLLLRLLDWRKDQVIPSWFTRWRETEQIAIMLREYHPMVVPGLLQTEGYARALFDGNEEAVQARMARQELLTRKDPKPPVLRCVIEESVLHRCIGSPDVMREQLRHLITVSGPELSIQVLPSGTTSGLYGAFALATLESGVAVLYAATAVRGLTTNDLQDVSVAVARFEAIRSDALPTKMSRELISRLADEKWT